MATGSRDHLLERINSFEYWHYPFDLGDGVVIRPSYAEKKLQLRDFIWPVVLDLCGGTLGGQRVIDVGCNSGFWSLEAHKSGAAYVLGIDARPMHIQQAELVRDALGINPEQLEYRQMSIYDLSRELVGEYDLCLLLRILQHLPHPLLALEKVREICCAHLAVDTHVVRMDQPVFYLHGEKPSNPLYGVEGMALEPSRRAVEKMLAWSGFTEIRAVPPKQPLGRSYFSGKRVLFTACVSHDVSKRGHL